MSRSVLVAWWSLLVRSFRPAVLAAFAVGSALLLGCGRSEFDDFAPVEVTDSGPDADARPETPIGCETVSTLVLEPSGAKVPVGTTSYFTARALCPDGSTQIVTDLASFYSDNPKVADMVGPGSVYAYSAGSARIHASYGGATAEADLIVTDDRLVDLRIDPGFADLAIGASQVFSATAFYASGSSIDVTASASWISDNPMVATVTAPGVVLGAGSGSVGLRATFSGLTAYAKLSVSGKAMKALEVSPTNPIVGLSTTVAMTATAIYTDGSKGDLTASCKWTTSDPSIASVALTGGSAIVRGVSAGAVALQAAYTGFIGVTTVTVTSAKLTGISLSPTAATIGVGASVGIKATANYSDGSAIDITSTAIWKSSDDATATVSSGVVKGVKVGNATVSATFGGLSSSAAITVSAAKLISIAVSPASATAPLGSKVAFKATGTYEGGSVRDITADVTWSTDDAAVASISNVTATKGELTPLEVGATVVRAKLDGLEGQAKVSVVAATVTSITISPSPLSLVVPTKGNAKATAKYSDGTTLDVTTTCTWATGDAKIATVSNASGAQGQVAAVAAGTTSLTCTQGGVTGSGTITVTGATLDQVTVSPIAPTCRVGDTLQFQATAISTGGTSNNVTGAATWSSSAPTILQPLGGPGRFRCLAKGTATVSATYGGKTGSTPVTVSDAVPVSLEVDPVTASIAVGTNQQYQAVAIMSDGTSRNVTGDPGTTFSSSAPSIASIATAGGAKGRATALAAGTTTIKATYAGLSGSATLTVTSAKVVSIQISPPAPSIPGGVSFPFTATAIYSDGTSREVTNAATWSSSNTAAIAVSNAVGSKGNATTFAAGTATVSASFDGITGTAPVNVTSAKLTKIQLTPFNPSLPVGFGVRLTATGVWDDGFTANVTSQATWTSSNNAVASVSTAAGSRGRVTPVAAGTATISAQYNGVVGSTTVTVTAATLTSISITPDPATVGVGSSQQLVATGKFSDGSTLDVTDYVGWASSDASIGDVSNATDTKGMLYGFKAGALTITATRGTVVGKSSANVL